MTSRRPVLCASVVMGAALAASGACAQEDFPTEPITIIVGYGAGGGTDSTVRALAEPVSEALGQPILVQNRPGAGGGVAALTVANAPADGYTLVATTSTTYTLEPQLLDVQYDPDDFEHIAAVVQAQEAFIAHVDRPYDTMADLVAAAKEDGRPVQYASFYQLDRLVMDFISSQTGVEFVPVPVKGGNGAMQAVLGDQVDFASSGGSYGPHVEAGTLKLLGAMTLDRLERFPDVQSMKDFGWDAGSEVFYVISAPAGTPEEVVRKLGDAFQNAIPNETVQRVFDERFMREVFFGPDEVDDALMRQRDMYGRMIEAK